jgi:hypothetical protein
LFFISAAKMAGTWAPLTIWKNLNVFTDSTFYIASCAHRWPPFCQGPPLTRWIHAGSVLSRIEPSKCLSQKELAQGNLDFGLGGRLLKAYPGHKHIPYCSEYIAKPGPATLHLKISALQQYVRKGVDTLRNGRIHPQGQ